MTRVDLRTFRSYDRAELRIGRGLTVLYGPNGAGKTNALEAIYFGLTARSCRTATDRELVQFGARHTRVAVETACEDGRHLLEVGLELGQPKRIRVDGSTADPGAQRAARPLVSVFLPDRLDLVKGPPARRRTHLDRFVAALWPGRGATPAAYRRALAQRNALLGRLRAGSAAPRLLDSWDAELAHHGAQLTADREAAVGEIAPAVRELGPELGLPAGVDLRYRPGAPVGDEQALRAALAEARETDVRRGVTGSGPHRDDVDLLYGGRSLRAFGSQGQQRLSLLVMLLAERRLLAGRGTPLMLLDDVMSELDSERRELLTDILGRTGQAVLTTTDPGQVPGADASDVARIAVRDSSLAYEAGSLAA